MIHSAYTPAINFDSLLGSFSSLAFVLQIKEDKWANPIKLKLKTNIYQTLGYTVKENIDI